MTLDELILDLRRFGETDEGYAAHHFSRFVETLHEVRRTWPVERGTAVLDIGAHWLHQAVLWADAGYRLTAVDLPATFGREAVRAAAAAHGIRLVPCANLEACAEFAAIQDGSINLVLFTEILEHITFNPVAFWREVHRVLAPGGRIVITTPNYYWAGGRFWDPARLLSGFGGGLPVDEILWTPTHGHHWKEYARREVIKYFCLLSPDFNTIKAIYPSSYQSIPPRNAFSRFMQRHVPWLRQNLHLEIELTGKTHGIVATPRWCDAAPVAPTSRLIALAPFPRRNPPCRSLLPRSRPRPKRSGSASTPRNRSATGS